MKIRKTDAVVEAMKGTESITIAMIRSKTGYVPAEIGGILASLERQGRVEKLKLPSDHSGRNQWKLIKAEKRQVNRVVNPCQHQRLLRDQVNHDQSMIGLELQNIFAQMRRKSAASYQTLND